jgi:hypothetical protein
LNFFPINNCSTGTFGINCSFSDNICSIIQPCLNSGSCFENKTIERGYNCECPWGFQGINCEDDQRPCKPFTCFQRGKSLLFYKKNFFDNFYYYLGTCINTSSTQFKCQCNPGYESVRCEKTVNFCANVTCQNRGVCFQQLLNYTCHCLEGFSGRHCEIIGTSAVVHAYVSKGKFIENLFFFIF